MRPTTLGERFIRETILSVELGLVVPRLRRIDELRLVLRLLEDGVVTLAELIRKVVTDRRGVAQERHNCRTETYPRDKPDTI